MDEHSYLSTPASSPRWLRDSQLHHVHHIAYQQQPRCGMGYDDGDDQTPTALPVAPPSPFVDSSYSPATTTPDLAGLSILDDVGSASSELASPCARVDAPSFLPYNFTLPDHLQAKGPKHDLQQRPPEPPTPPDAAASEPAESFKVPLAVVSAVAAAASLAPVQAQPAKRQGAKRPVAKPKRRPTSTPVQTSRQAKPQPQQQQQRRIAPKKAPAPALAAPTEQTVETVVARPPSEPLNNDDNTKQGWEKIMQTVDTQDAKLQRNKWWWYLLAEKTRLTQSGGGMAGAAPDLEKAQGAIEHHQPMVADPGVPAPASGSAASSPAAASPPPAVTYDPMPLLTVEAVSPSPSRRLSPALHSTSEEEEGGDDDDYNPDMVITNNDDDYEEEEDDDDEDQEDDADWRPQARGHAKSRPATGSKKRNTQRRLEAKGATNRSRGGGGRSLRGTPTAAHHGRDLDEAASLVTCSSPPKRRRVGSVSGSSGGGALQPTAQAAAPAAAAAAHGGRAGDSEPANRKLPPRSRLKGLIEWMKSSGDASGLPGGLPGHHPFNG